MPPDHGADASIEPELPLPDASADLEVDPESETHLARDGDEALDLPPPSDSGDGDGLNEADLADAELELDSDEAPPDAEPDAPDLSGPSDSADSDDSDLAVTDTGSAPCGTCATGRLRFERRRPKADASALLPPELSPLARHPLALATPAGLVVHTLTDEQGAFEVALPSGVDRYSLTFAALVPADPASPFGEPSVAVLVGDAATLPTSFSSEVQLSEVWAWTFDGTPGLPADLIVGVSAGSGALAILEVVERVRAEAEAQFGICPLTLAVIWQPGKTWPCLSCFLDARYRPVTWVIADTRLVFDRAIFISGTNATPHHWTPPLVAHELGHWLIDCWSRPPLVGGSHSWDRRVSPPLAWSEGAATFLGQWALRRHTDAPSRFFTMQQSVQYWVDIELIGRPPSSDDSNLDILIPSPRPGDPIDQPLSEGVVAAILWDLFDGEPLSRDDEPLDFGLAVLRWLASPRLVGDSSGPPLDRGAPGPDLVDLLDALRCSPDDTDATPLDPVLLGFPYDEAFVCPLLPR